jgi:hypothetical protein
VQGKEGDSTKMQLRGCFEADKKVGRIRIKPFTLNIRSLNTDFTYVKKFKGLEESKKLIEFMKYHEATGSDPSKHLVDLVTDSFSEFKNQKNYKFDSNILNIGSNSLIPLNPLSKYLTLQKKSKILTTKTTERILIELE